MVESAQTGVANRRGKTYSTSTDVSPSSESDEIDARRLFSIYRATNALNPEKMPGASAENPAPLIAISLLSRRRMGHSIRNS